MSRREISTLVRSGENGMFRAHHAPDWFRDSVTIAPVMQAPLSVYRDQFPAVTGTQYKGPRFVKRGMVIWRKDSNSYYQVTPLGTDSSELGDANNWTPIGVAAGDVSHDGEETAPKIREVPILLFRDMNVDAEVGNAQKNIPSWLSRSINGTNDPGMRDEYCYISGFLSDRVMLVVPPASGFPPTTLGARMGALARNLQAANGSLPAATLTPFVSLT